MLTILSVSMKILYIILMISLGIGFAKFAYEDYNELKLSWHSKNRKNLLISYVAEVIMVTAVTVITVLVTYSWFFAPN